MGMHFTLSVHCCFSVSRLRTLERSPLFQPTFVRVQFQHRYTSPGETFTRGKALESNPSPTLIVYSFGVSTDSSFEAVMLQRTNCEIWGYDYTVSSFGKDIPKHQSSRSHK